MPLTLSEQMREHANPQFKQTHPPTFRVLESGYLGDGNGVVTVPGKAGMVYVRLHTIDTQRIEGWNLSNVPDTEGLSVLVEKVWTGEGSCYLVLGRAPVTTGDAVWGSGYIGGHHAQHERSDEGNITYDAVDVYSRMIVSLRGTAQVTPDWTVYVEPGWYPSGATAKRWTGGNSPAFSTSGIGASESRYDLLYLRLSDDALVILQGTAAATPSYPTVPSDCIPICWVKLPYGATAVYDAYILDARLGGSATLAGASHARQHVITATADHTSTATSGKMLKADASGLPIDATNTDSEVAAAVTASHAAITLDADAAVLLDLTGQEIGLDTQAANAFFAGPATGAANEPTFRAITADDVAGLMGGGNPSFIIDGALAVATEVGAYTSPHTSTITAVYIYCKDTGTASSTIVDVHKNGATIFTNQANRPTLAYNDANKVAKSGTPDVTAIVENDVLTVDIDQVATGAANLQVIIDISTSGGGGGGAALTVEEQDAAPSVANVTKIKVTNGTLTDDGSGVVSLAIGGSVSYPIRATMWHDEALVTVGNALTHVAETQQKYNFHSYQHPPANGDTFTQTFVLAAGTYTFSILGIIDTDQGIADWSVDGTPIVTGQDWYNGSTVRNTVKAVGSITIATDGVHTLQCVTNGKHASSSNYYKQLTKYWFR